MERRLSITQVSNGYVVTIESFGGKLHAMDIFTSTSERLVFEEQGMMLSYVANYFEPKLDGTTIKVTKVDGAEEDK